MELHERINGCIAIEQAAASIYASFMKLFSEEKEFWMDLKNDEMDHSTFLAEAGYLEVFNRLPVNALPPTIPYIRKTLEFAENMKARIRFNPVSLEDALMIALKLEETMAEAFVNELMFDLTNYADKSVIKDFEQIIIDERVHISKIRDKMFKKGFLRVS
jgi:rubrerythrin